MAKFYTILTKVGEALHANAQITQTTVPWTHMAIGDGGGNPVVPKQEQTSLVREVTRVPITSIAPDPNNPNWMIVEAVLPNNVGGWTVRETAIMGTPGGAQCIAVGNYPDTYKPVLAEGSVREMVLRMVVAVIGAGTVNLVIDPAVAIASRKFVEEYVGSELAKLDTKQSVRVATTVNIALTGLQAIDGVALAAGDRVLVKDQAAAKDNGIYVAVAGVWARSADADTAAKLTSEMCVGVEQGTVNGDSLWMLTTDAPITLGATPLVFEVSGGRPLATKAWVEGLVATTERRGIIEVATTQEVFDGVDTERSVTPQGLRAVVPHHAFTIASGESINGLKKSNLYYSYGGLDGPRNSMPFYGWVRHSSTGTAGYSYQEAFSEDGSFWRRGQYQSVWGDWVPVRNAAEIDLMAQGLVNLISGREPSIPAGATSQYWAGDKTWKPAADIPVRAATETQTGVSELATLAEALLGNDDERVLTPKKLAGYMTQTFQSLKSPSGYQKLPGGLILQWMTGLSFAVSGDVEMTVTHPVAFPGMCLHRAVTPYNNSSATSPDRVLSWYSDTGSDLTKTRIRCLNSAATSTGFGLFLVGA